MEAVTEQAAAGPDPTWTKRRLGYLLWSVALAFFFIPEILAASKSADSSLPFTTLSGLVGHLEYRYPAFEVITTAVIFCTLDNLEHWLRAKGELGKAIGWLLSFVLVWGFVFLLFHLVFYPFPDITKILN